MCASVRACVCVFDVWLCASARVGMNVCINRNESKTIVAVFNYKYLQDLGQM